MIISLRLVFVISIIASAIIGSGAATLILPQNRNAFYADEAIEFAVAGLSNGEQSKLELQPAQPGNASVPLEFVGTDGTVIESLPPFSLAPDTYKIVLDGVPQPNVLTVSTGVLPSTFLLSNAAATARLRATGADFQVGNAFGYGLLDRNGLPRKDIRGLRSQGMQALDNAVAANLPTLIYTYWTGFTTVTPFMNGTSWVDPQVQNAMRVLNFSAAERLRHYPENIVSVGTIGIPRVDNSFAYLTTNADDVPYFAAHGVNDVSSPGKLSDPDWLKYMAARTDEIPSSFRQASKDLKTVWPGIVFSTPTCVGYGIESGNDPMQQAASDIPMSIYFGDGGHTRLQSMATNYVAKANNPDGKVSVEFAQFEFDNPQPVESMNVIVHRLALNTALASGMANGFWQANQVATDADMLGVDDPVLRLGPLFAQMSCKEHDIAILWSATQLEMVSKAFASNVGTAPKTKKVSALADDGTTLTASVQTNAYTEESDYSNRLLIAHDALDRAGYLSHIVHERTLASGILKNYHVLLILGQTYPLAADVMSAVADFENHGGKVMVDAATTAAIPGATKIAVNIDVDANYSWQISSATKDSRQRSYLNSTYALDAPARNATAQFRSALGNSGIKRVVRCDSPFLGCERQVGGEGMLYLLINGEDDLPKPPPAQYDGYYYSPATFTYSLDGIAPGSVGYMIEGTDWKTVTPFGSVTSAHTSQFAPCEMKLILVAPRQPSGIHLTAAPLPGKIDVAASIPNLHMPWPIVVTVSDPNGKELYRVYRSMDVAGTYRESFPIGVNSSPGIYQVHVFSNVGGIGNGVSVAVAGEQTAANTLGDSVRVFDGTSIRSFLASKPSITVIYASDDRKAAAADLAADLANCGMDAKAAAEADVMTHARYPRIWTPNFTVYSPKESASTPVSQSQNANAPSPDDPNPVPADQIKHTITLRTDETGQVVATTADGKVVSGSWQQPGTFATIGDGGWLDARNQTFYAAGCHLFINSSNWLNDHNDTRNWQATTDEVRDKYSRPWARLETYIGSDFLPPALPEAYSAPDNLILIGDSESGQLPAALQASEVLPQVADSTYPGPGKALITFAWSPFAVGKNVIMIGASDSVGIDRGIHALVSLAGSVGR